MCASPNLSPAPHLSYDTRWQQLCNHIQTTDDISFKLLSLVPIISVAGIAVALLKADSKSTPLVSLLAIFAAGITLALWRWERKNIQMCIWLRARAAEFEKSVVSHSEPGHFFGFPEKSSLAKHGKREAEKMIYGFTIAAWLLLPWAVFFSDPAASASMTIKIGAGVYVILALVLGGVAWRDLNTKIDAPPDLANQT
jgi:hypothetical protein